MLCVNIIDTNFNIEKTYNIQIKTAITTEEDRLFTVLYIAHTLSVTFRTEILFQIISSSLHDPAFVYT